jgi:hypothetical protein
MVWCYRQLTRGGLFVKAQPTNISPCVTIQGTIPEIIDEMGCPETGEQYGSDHNAVTPSAFFIHL